MLLVQKIWKHDKLLGVVKGMDILASDINTRIEPVAKVGFIYAMIFTDDFSGYMFTYLLKMKSDTVQA